MWAQIINTLPGNIKKNTVIIIIINKQWLQ